MTSEFQEYVYDDDWNLVAVKKYFPTAPSEPEPPQEAGSIVYLVPWFELGACEQDPSLGSGGALAWYTVEEFTNGTCINLNLYIHSAGGASGIGSGGYEVYLPDELDPAEEYYSGHANMWLSGGGISEFSGSVKWTLRNATKGPKLIFTFHGKEWTINDPKPYADFKLRASIRYFL